MENQSARISGKLLADVAGLATDRLNASNSPDSFIPSRTAALTTAYSTQRLISTHMPHTAIAKTQAVCKLAVVITPPVGDGSTVSGSLSTSPVENSEALGASGAEDGQGACTTFSGVDRVSAPLVFDDARDLVAGVLCCKGRLILIQTVRL